MCAYRPTIDGIVLKKQHGQHFLKDESYIIEMLNAVLINDKISIMEIGCGQGVLTKHILESKCKQLKVFEIDPEWSEYVKNLYGKNTKLNITESNILDVDWSTLQSDAPLILLSNLPYQITFPLLFLLQKNRAMFLEGVIMIQEEVAQKIVQKSGKGYGFNSLYMQRYFEWKLLNRVPPEAFFPAPKVFSRLLHFKPIINVDPIQNEDEFWKFIKICFHQPRRTLKNNLFQSHYSIEKLDENILKKRAQELAMKDFLSIWNLLTEN